MGIDIKGVWLLDLFPTITSMSQRHPQQAKRKRTPSKESEDESFPDLPQDREETPTDLPLLMDEVMELDTIAPKQAV